MSRCRVHVSAPAALLKRIQEAVTLERLLEGTAAAAPNPTAEDKRASLHDSSVVTAS